MKTKVVIPSFALAALFVAGSTLAQPPSAPNDAWRYKLQKVEDGFLRLDAQTGQVSHCKPKDSNWICETVADDRAALEAEIKRLNDRVATLEKQANDPTNRFRTPSDQEIEQVMGFFEKMMKRFRGVVENLKKDWEMEAPNKG